MGSRPPRGASGSGSRWREVGLSAFPAASIGPVRLVGRCGPSGDTQGGASGASTGASDPEEAGGLQGLSTQGTDAVTRRKAPASTSEAWQL